MASLEPESVYLPLVTNFVWCLGRPAAVKVAAYFYQMRAGVGDQACLDRVLFRRNYGHGQKLMWEMSIVRFLKVVKKVEFDVGIDLALKKVWDKNFTDIIQPIKGRSLAELVDDERLGLAELMLIGNTSFSFITCGSIRDEGLRFDGYLKPLDNSVWTAILICSALLSLLMMYHVVSPGSDLIHRTKLSLIYAFIGVLSVNVETFPSTTKRYKPVARLLLAAFALVSILTINVYKSVVTNDITAPLGSLQPTLFSHLVPHNFKMIGSFLNSDYYTEDSGLAIPITLSKYRIGYGELDEEFHVQMELWKRRNGLDPVRNYTISDIFRYFKCNSLTESGDLDKLTMSLPCSYHRNETIEFLARNPEWINNLEKMFHQTELARLIAIAEYMDIAKIPDKIADCKKSAFVFRTSSMATRHLINKILGPIGRSHKNRKPYVVSKDTLFSKRVFLMFLKLGWYSSMVRLKFAGVFEGGLYTFWENMIKYAQTAVAQTNMMKDDSHQGQELLSNIGTSFIILLIGLLFSLVVVSCENPKSVVSAVVKPVRIIYRLARACIKRKRKARKVRFRRKLVFVTCQGSHNSNC